MCIHKEIFFYVDRHFLLKNAPGFDSELFSREARVSFFVYYPRFVSFLRGEMLTLLRGASIIASEIEVELRQREIDSFLVAFPGDKSKRAKSARGALSATRTGSWRAFEKKHAHLVAAATNQSRQPSDDEKRPNNDTLHAFGQRQRWERLPADAADALGAGNEQPDTRQTRPIKRTGNAPHLNIYIYI